MDTRRLKSERSGLPGLPGLPGQPGLPGLPGQPGLRSILLATLVFFFGLQAFRVFLPKVIWFGGAYLSAEQQALFALGVFLLTLLAPLLARWLGERRLLLLASGGSALVYLAYQFSHSALFYLILAVLGIILWAWFFVMWIASPRSRLAGGGSGLVYALPLAFLLDTGLRILLLGYDLAWRHSAASLVTSLLLVAAALAFLASEMREKSKEITNQNPGWAGALTWQVGLTWQVSLTWIGLGPFLYLAMSNIHNAAAFAVASGFPDRLAFLWTGFFSCLGAAACLLAAQAERRRVEWAALAGLASLAALLGMNQYLGQPWGLAWLAYSLLSVSLWAGMGFLMAGSARVSIQKPGLLPTAVAFFLALVVMLVILFLVAQFEMYWMSIVAGAILGLLSLWAASFREVTAQSDGSSGLPVQPGFRLPKFAVRPVVITASIVLLVALGNFLLRTPVRALDPPNVNAPLKVMTYNIHQGINADLMVDLEAIAAVIAAENPDVVALNEVNRARATNGFLDVLPLISQYTGLPYIFGANYADGQYGNALLSRYPIVEWENTHYQTNTTEVRGVLRAVIQGPGAPFTFFATHLDHIGGTNNARLAQAGELLALWNGQPRSLILGDLNAIPSTPEMQVFPQGGFVDVLALGGLGDAFTFWDATPTPGRRIDYIWVTPDLTLLKVWAPQSRASDHLPVLAEIQP